MHCCKKHDSDIKFGKQNPWNIYEIFVLKSFYIYDYKLFMLSYAFCFFILVLLDFYFFVLSTIVIYWYTKLLFYNYIYLLFVVLL